MKSDINNIVRTDPRLSGQVVRYHSWPTVRPQSTSAHMWDVTRILLAIYPECPREALISALFHDVGEIASGDAPFDAKRASPTLKKEMDRLEDAGHNRMVIPWSLPAKTVLGALEKWAVKVADIIEMWEHGFQEMMMGNKFGLGIIHNTETALRVMFEDVSEDGKFDIRHRAVRYMDRRRAAWSFAGEAA